MSFTICGGELMLRGMEGPLPDPTCVATCVLCVLKEAADSAGNPDPSFPKHAG